VTSSAAAPPAPAGARDWMDLLKVRLNAMVVASAAAGAWLGREVPHANTDPMLLLHAGGGTALVAAGVAALNQVMERDADGRMHRTRNRPVPSGRIAPRAATAVGAALVVAGLAWLLLAAGSLPAVLAAATAALYLAVYTPLKSRSSVNTLVGAVPGALPPVIGWAAATGGIEPGAWLLFAILYLWQIPHFLAIAWLYREDYRRGGLVMITAEDPTGASAGRQAVLHAVALLAASLFALRLGMGGPVYAAGAILVGVGYALAAAGFARRRDDASARGLLWASLAYLPLLLGLMAVEAGQN
jgi:protoheme IX farnesyltransferase